MNSTRPSKEVNRVLSAAIVSKTFREALITDPTQAINKGFMGESFVLTAQEQQMLQAIQAETLADFASQILDAQQRISLPEKNSGQTYTILNNYSKSPIR